MARANTVRRGKPRNSGPSIIQVIEDPDLLEPALHPTESWERWKVALAAMFGLPPPKCREIDPVEFYQRHTGRLGWPTQQANEAWMICGVRAGKSRVSALIAVYLAVFRDYSAFLSPGEYGTVMVMAADRKQARVVFGFIKAFLLECEVLAPLVENETADTITLTNRIRIEVHTASYRSIRGYTCVAAICDEIAVWQSEGSSNPDTEIVTAIRSRFATIPNAMMVAISSPYARSGELWETYKRHFGPDGDPGMFVWQAATRDMHPSVEEEFVAEQYRRDSARAAAEYGGEFRTDVERYVPIELVKACIPETGRIHIPPRDGIAYRAFVDPSGGGSDSMVLTIGHRQGNAVVQDALFAVPPPFVPSNVVKQMVAFCRPYKIYKVVGDRWGGEFPREGFKSNGIDYEVCTRSKSDLYVDFRPILGSVTIELLDDATQTNELTSLERRVERSGREIIDHPKHGHDDRANAVAGVASLLAYRAALSPVWGSGRRGRLAS